MTDETPPQKAHDVSKNDPEYQVKVSEVLQKRFEEEKKRAEERERLKMEAGRKKTSGSTSAPAVSSEASQQQPQDLKDPEEVVKRKDVAALVAQLNNSFAIIEKNRLKTEAVMNCLKEFAKNLNEVLNK